MNDLLEINGYIHFKDVLTPQELEYARRCYNKNKVNYKNIKIYIENIMFKPLSQYLKWDPVCTNYRVSNNNNVADSCIYHRDIYCQDPDLEIIPSYTCLSYLDSTFLEIIPGSHTKLVMNIKETFNNYFKSIIIKVEPTDILIINSTILHRGIFTKIENNRRIIQAFELYPSYKLFMEHRNKILYVKGNDHTKNNMIIKANDIKLINYITKIYFYINAATGYGWSKTNNTLSRWNLHKYKYLAYNVGQIDNPKDWDDINKHIDVYKTHELPNNLRSEFDFYVYTRQFIHMSVYIFIFIVCVIYIICR